MESEFANNMYSNLQEETNEASKLKDTTLEERFKEKFASVCTSALRPPPLPPLGPLWAFSIRFAF